tara:strand:- start:9358 stop:10182 length:825 start_codon:yes stop_codon:yes gene_type:complete
MVFVIKANGEKARFEKKKIIGTCLRAGVSKQQAEQIASQVEAKARNGMRTRDVLRLVLQKLDALQTGHGEKGRLRGAISDLNPELHEFEKYISHVFKAHGYKTRWNQIVQGEIIEHQADVIVEKDGKRFLIECKHHRNPHRMTGLDVPLTYWAILDDIQKGFKKGITKKRFDNMWIVTNTKFSMHAIKYAKGKGLILTGWGQPRENNLPDLVHKIGLYPITVLDLSPAELAKISNAGFLLLNELLIDENELRQRTKLSSKRISDIVNKAKRVLS